MSSNIDYLFSVSESERLFYVNILNNGVYLDSVVQQCIVYALLKTEFVDGTWKVE